MPPPEASFELAMRVLQQMGDPDPAADVKICTIRFRGNVRHPRPGPDWR